MALLDYPFHIAVAGDLATTILLSLLEGLTHEGPMDTLRGLRLVVIGWAILASG